MVRAISFAALWTPRVGETGGPTECVSSSALVDSGTSRGGAAADRGGAVSKEAKKFAQFWVTWCLQRLHVSS